MFEQLTEMQFKKFRDVIYDASGMHFTDVNKPILESRLKDRLRKSGLQDIEDYFKLISTNHEELKILLDAVTTNLTSFFRNKIHFDGFESGVIPEVKKNKAEKKFRVWSAGCSTGEEPYSIAMVLKDKLPDWKIEIVASDISFNVLMKAKEGYYDKSKISGIPQEYIKRFMLEIGDGYVMKDEIKNVITFDYHNLKNEPSFKNFDAVFCRNVIIYFDSKAQENVINMIYNTMNMPGYLFIGHSESLFGMKTKFVFTKFGDTCLYMKK